MRKWREGGFFFQATWLFGLKQGHEKEHTAVLRSRLRSASSWVMAGSFEEVDDGYPPLLLL